VRKRGDKPKRAMLMPEAMPGCCGNKRVAEKRKEK